MDWQPVLSSTAAMIIGAFLLDLATGDPRWLPHPVVLMGRVIAHAESAVRTGKARRDFLAGMALSLSVIALSFVGAWSLVVLFRMLPFWFYFIFIAALASTTLATRGLLDAVKRIEAPLVAGNVAAARRKLSHIVGRETSNLNQDRVMRATLESLAESTCDGIIAPLFYLFLGGVPLAMAYKAVSTLDSMIGYRTERYFYFGKFAARLDDAVNFVPARLTAFFMIVAASAAHLNAVRALHAVWRDHANHLSPNAGYPEAALAGAFGIRLGGPSIYFGKEVHKPHIGDDLTPVRIEMLREGRILCLLTAILSLASFALLSTMRE
ncbi:MAG TPA: adenosylcobinamide-phosphate synthase CbiB [Candidatus Binatia bacterium]|nr:adenosylcobinamide-phosphate synthase CbiB [Candidatus Binatia bacterium]